MKDPEKRLNLETNQNNQEVKSEAPYKMINLSVKLPTKTEKIYKNLVLIVYNGQIKELTIPLKIMKNNYINQKLSINQQLLNYSEITECNHERPLKIYNQKIFNDLNIFKII